MSGLSYLASNSLGFAKACLRTVIGRQAIVHDRERFYWRFLLHTLGWRIRTITHEGNPREREGPCSHAMAMIGAINIARLTGLTYVHKMPAVIAHADRPMRDWIAAWEQELGLGGGEIAYNQNLLAPVSYYGNQLNFLNCFGITPSEQDEALQKLIPELRQRFYLRKSPRKNPVLAIAVHIRRGDVSETANKHFFTATHIVWTTVELIKETLKDMGTPYSLSIYSQGAGTDFEAFKEHFGAKLLLNTDPLFTLGELIEADILVTAKGSFSRYAAMICDGIKIVEAKSPRPSDPYITCREDGWFEVDRLIQLLKVAAK